MEEQFAANKYVAACDHGTQYGNYKFECNAGQTGHENETHESPTNDEYLTGYYLDDADTSNKESIPVIIWTAGGTNLHATKNLDRDSWVVDRS